MENCPIRRSQDMEHVLSGNMMARHLARVQRAGGGVAPPEGILPRKAESTLVVFPTNTPPAANTNR
jgi:hypothetical protein